MKDLKLLFNKAKCIIIDMVKNDTISYKKQQL